MGFYNVKSKPHLLQELELFDYAVMFIGLIFNVLLIIFVVVAILLVFSLLLISVETKQFEFGVMRLVGLTKLGFVCMILTQAAMFVIPAVTMAMIVSFPMIFAIYKSLFEEDLGYMPSIAPSTTAFLNALFIGVLIPFLSSIVPIRRGLSANLTDTLDVTRSKTKGSIISIVDNKALEIGPYLLYGTVACVFGIAVYYGLPAALLRLNLGMLLTIFFMLLLGMLLGLVLFSVNLQSAMEFLLLYLLLFWERKSMRAVLKKNLIAHKRKNRLTAIIYALSLGCIIFLLTSANLQINLIVSTTSLAGSDIAVLGGYGSVQAEIGGDETGFLRASMVDNVIRNYTN